jgi:hypothetical protein
MRKVRGRVAPTGRGDVCFRVPECATVTLAAWSTIHDDLMATIEDRVIVAQ